MVDRAFLAEVTEDERCRCSSLQPKFQGDIDELAVLYRVLDSPIRSKQRRDALANWSSLNTTRIDSISRGHITKKGPFKKIQRGLNLRGLVIDGGVVGPIDLRGADLKKASFPHVALTKADFADADLRGADFSSSWLRGANLANAKLQGANFAGACLADADVGGAEGDGNTIFDHADLQGANLSMACFKDVSLVCANLQLAQMLETDLRGANLKGCKVFGIAAWSPRLDASTCQENLLVTPEQSVPIGRGRRQNAVEVRNPVNAMTTESLEHAHLIHLMMNPDLSELLESVTCKGVLLLGRFSGEHGDVLDALRIALRANGYLPLKFDFRKPDDRTLKETVLTLAGLCRFVIADLTEASSIPLELVTIVKDYKIPVVPIQRQARQTFSMFESIEQEFRDRVLPVLEYTGIDDLVAALGPGIIQPALERADELVAAKRTVTPTRSTHEYLDGE